MGHFYSAAERQAAEAKEIAELEAAMQEGSQDPTQSSEENAEGSPEVAFKETTEQLAAEQSSHEPVQDLNYWKDRALTSEKRFNVSKPKYDSNIFQLRKENTSLQASKIQVQRELNELRQTIASKRPDLISDKLNSKEVVDVLGQETADSIRQNIVDTNARLDAQEARTAKKQIEDDEAKLNDSVDQRYRGFMRTLTELVPDQAVVNKDPKFLEYLKDIDPDLGVVRFELLREAEKAGSAARVASFFTAFKRLAKTQPTDSINKRISPDSRSASHTDINTAAEGNKISMAYVDKFFNDLQKGVYKGRYSEQMAIQKSIDEAYVAGNII